MNTLLNTENSFCEITIMYSSTGDRIVHKREITGHRGRKGQDIFYYFFINHNTLSFCESQWYAQTTGDKAHLPFHYAEVKKKLTV